MILGLARKSLWNRRGTALLTLVSLAISVALILGINHLRHEAKESFTSTISGTDLIVGARSGATNLLLYSVFRIGNATKLTVSADHIAAQCGSGAGQAQAAIVFENAHRIVPTAPVKVEGQYLIDQRQAKGIVE